LYAVPGACSLAPHIVLEELKIPYELKLFGWKDTAMRDELKKINPMGQVPTIVTDEGYPLAEAAVILQYLAAKKPGAFLAQSGTERYKTLEWLNFVTTELHKAFIPLFNPKVFSDDESHLEAIRKKAEIRLKKYLGVAEKRFSNGECCTGEHFTIADIYLFVVLNWLGHFKVDLTPYPKLKAFYDRAVQRPAVVAAMKAEKLS
ncbi:MAG: glutathione binding-like protein, partial [Deltaproteobacteria bacterium]|nr:glutathione binding-like protein [Deltaproteobacteria bacterium]